MRRAESGFVLLEAVVALMIISVVAIATMSQTAAQTRAARHVAPALEARALAEDRLAAVKLLSARELGMLPDSFARGEFAAPFAAYAWTTRVTRALNEHDLFDIHVEIVSPDAKYDVRTRLYRPAPRVLP